MVKKADLLSLKDQLEGDFLIDDLHRRLYATDASVYRILPLAVACPKTSNDIRLIIDFVTNHNISIIPRTAGTSLAGQCVGVGIVLDFSKYFNKIIDFDEVNKTVTVEPGVVRDELNLFLKPYGLFFAPNTSTSNRCMIGGMVGNNSSGSTSIKYGVTRDKVLSIEAFLSDGSKVNFEAISKEKLKNKLLENTLEANIYSEILDLISPLDIQNKIRSVYPKSDIHRRNSAYAVDKLMDSSQFNGLSSSAFNLCDLLTGSEGTLAISTKITLQLDKLPPKNDALIVLHFNTINDCLKAVNLVMEHDLFSCEMLDKTILDLTKHNKTQLANRQFLVSDPEAILMCELRSQSQTDLSDQIERLTKAIKSNTNAYAFPVLRGDAVNNAIELRKAGLGLLGNMIGDKKAVACIEDSAVSLKDLPNYIEEFSLLMLKYNQKPVYYAHAGAGELHLRPVLNLKSDKDIVDFKTITMDVAELVKKYNGTMSGEHGNGIVRSELIPFMLGEDIYELLKKIKLVFDPLSIFNPGKIIDALPMDKNFRTDKTKFASEIKTLMDFSESNGIIREAEKCNGSGDCRKLQAFGGVMCPSYRVTKDEKHTTRARANALREYLAENDKRNVFDQSDLKAVFDLCISCKACKTECPSSVDVAALKAEFEYQYYKSNKLRLRTKLFAYNNEINKLIHPFSSVYNKLINTKWSSKLIKKLFSIADDRSIPGISSNTLTSIIKQHEKHTINRNINKEVYLFVDEFSNYLDANIGKDAYDLLTILGYNVKTLKNKPSGRALISKGLLQEAKRLVNYNVNLFKNKINETTPLIGIEPSAILSFKDEYLRLADDKKSALSISKHTYTIEEFIAAEYQKGNIRSDAFNSQSLFIKIHGHCHHKSLGDVSSLKTILEIPSGFKADILPTGCCGMAGSFGYEKEHYDISMKMGALALFPHVEANHKKCVIAANGTSCRHQILDGTSVISYHPVTVLRNALIC